MRLWRFFPALFTGCFLWSAVFCAGAERFPFLRQLEAMGLQIVLLIPSGDISAPPQWSPDGETLLVRIGRRWVTLRLEKVRLTRGTWGNGLPIAVNTAEEALTPLPKDAWPSEEKRFVSRDRVRCTQTDTAYLFREGRLSTELLVQEGGASPRTVWSTPGERSHTLLLSPDERFLLFIAEKTGLVLMAR